MESTKKPCSFSQLYRKLYFILTHLYLLCETCITHLASQLSNETKYLHFMDTNGKETVTDM